jgi:hypothetical protein
MRIRWRPLPGRNCGGSSVHPLKCRHGRLVFRARTAGINTEMKAYLKRRVERAKVAAVARPARAMPPTPGGSASRHRMGWRPESTGTVDPVPERVYRVADQLRATVCPEPPDLQCRRRVGG